MNMVAYRLDELLEVPQRSQLIVNGECDMHGAFQVPAIYFYERFINPKPVCPQCKKEQSDLSLKEKERQEKNGLLEASGVPLKFRCAEIKSHPRELQAAGSVIEACQEYVDSWATSRRSGNGLLLVGNVGTGKTYLACAMARAIIDGHLQQPVYTTASGLLQDVRRAYDRDSCYSEHGVLNRYCQVPLLILDEIGVKRNTENERATLMEVVDRRYSGLKPTIFISNLPVGELGSSIDERFVDRLKEQSLMLLMNWESLRSRSS